MIMPSTDIDQLYIDIQSSSQKAVGGIDKVIGSLDNL